MRIDDNRCKHGMVKNTCGHCLGYKTKPYSSSSRFDITFLISEKAFWRRNWTKAATMKGKID